MNSCKIILFVLFFGNFIIKKLVRTANISVFLLEDIKYFVRLNFFAAFIASLLNYCAKLTLHSLRHLNSVIVSKNKCHTALAALRIDTNNRLIFTSYVGWVNRKIRDIPIISAVFIHIHFAFIDSVLMRA